MTRRAAIRGMIIVGLVTFAMLCLGLVLRERGLA
jgi:hypothetical protein